MKQIDTSDAEKWLDPFHFLYKGEVYEVLANCTVAKENDMPKLDQVQKALPKEPRPCPQCGKGKLYETGTSYSCNRCNYSEYKP